jgi:hypothetical protein
MHHLSVNAGEGVEEGAPERAAGWGQPVAARTRVCQPLGLAWRDASAPFNGRSVRPERPDAPSAGAVWLHACCQDSRLAPDLAQ